MPPLEPSQFDEIMDLHHKSLEFYKKCLKPNNYIPNWILRRLSFRISKEELYCTIKGISESPSCPICGSKRKFINFSKGFASTCLKRECINKLISTKGTGRTYESPLKGKTYKEIYGDEPVKCGFKKGEENIAKDPEIRKKISEGVIRSYEKNFGELREVRRKFFIEHPSLGVVHRSKPTIFDDYGNKYRSRLEANFSNLLIENNIPFEYEKPFKMKNGRMKYVDFVIDNKLFIEISGYAWESWKKDFDAKIKVLRDSLPLDDYIILVLVSDKNLSEIIERQPYMHTVNSFINSYESKNLLRGIKFYRSIIKFNEEFSKCSL